MVAHTHNRSHSFEILSSLVSWPPPASRTAPSWPFQRALLLPALRPLCVSPPAPRATSGGHFHSALFLALTSPSKPRGTSPMIAAVPTGCLKGIWHFTGTNLAPAPRAPPLEVHLSPSASCSAAVSLDLPLISHPTHMPQQILFTLPSRYIQTPTTSCLLSSTHPPPSKLSVSLTWIIARTT